MRDESVNHTAALPILNTGTLPFNAAQVQRRDDGIALNIHPADLDVSVWGHRAEVTEDEPLRTFVAVPSLRDTTKRIFDLVAGLILVVLLSPIFVVTAIAIYVESGSPILFKQRRALCYGGQSFAFYKFRSMVNGADNMKRHLQVRNETDGALFKIKNDPRVTRVGRLIRRFSIDELPQLFNVLIGDMSLVGPRPLPVSDLEKTRGNSELWRILQARASAKPGVTGLWQVSGRSNLGFRAMIVLDTQYVNTRSFLLDIRILLRTIPTVLRGDGAC